MQTQMNTFEMTSDAPGNEMSYQVHNDSPSAQASSFENQGTGRVSNTFNPFSISDPSIHAGIVGIIAGKDESMTAEDGQNQSVSDRDKEYPDHEHGHSTLEITNEAMRQNIEPSVDRSAHSPHQTQQTSMNEGYSDMTINTVDTPDLHEPPSATEADSPRRQESNKANEPKMHQQNMPATSASEDQSFPSGVFDITVLKTGKERQTGIINFAYHIETLIGESYAGRFSFDIRYPYQLSSTPVPNQPGYQGVLLTQHYASKRTETEADFNAKIHKEYDADSLESLDVERTVFSRSMDKGTAKAVYRALSKAIDLAVQGKLQVQQEETQAKLANVVVEHTQAPQRQQQENASSKAQSVSLDDNKQPMDFLNSAKTLLIASSAVAVIAIGGIAYTLGKGSASTIPVQPAMTQQPTTTMGSSAPTLAQPQNDTQNNQSQGSSLNDQPLLWSPQ